MVISAIEGMAGVGKTQLAVHAGHLLHQQQPFDRVLFVNLRGFHPDPAQPPADPAAVLDGFLRLLGIPGQQIPHDLDARAAAYRHRLAGTRTLVVLDNAATADQVRPLLPAHTGLPHPGHQPTQPHRPARRDPPVRGRLHPRRGLGIPRPRPYPRFPSGRIRTPRPGSPAAAAHLPLALGLVAGHIRSTPGWTLTDHADRLDERHHDRRLDTGVELALHLSYQHLPTPTGNDCCDWRRCTPARTSTPTPPRPWPTPTCPPPRTICTTFTAITCCSRATSGRYTFHDLVRAYATIRATDEDRPPERRAALTRLFDHYLAVAAAAMNTLYPAEFRLRPRIPVTSTRTLDLSDPDTALGWLDIERPNLVAVAAHTAANRWHTHTIRLSRTLHRYLSGGHYTDAVTVHGHAHRAVIHTGDATEHAHALNDLGVALWRLGRYGLATEHLQQALALFRQAGDPDGQALALNDLGIIAHGACRFQAAADYFGQALTLYRQAGDRNGEARGLTGLGNVEAMLGRHRQAIDYHEQALLLHRQTGDPDGEAYALLNLGDVEVLSGRYGLAGNHLQQALTLYRQLGNRTGVSAALDLIGVLHTRLGRPAQAAGYHQRALTGFRETGFRGCEPWALNGLGEAAHAAGRTADALTHHTDAHTIAADAGSRDQQARALTGLGCAHHALGNLDLAREHFRQALVLWTDLGLPEADQTRVRLSTLATSSNGTARPADSLQEWSLL